MTVGDMGRRGSSRRLTLILVNLAAVLERADEALLPAVYDQVGKAFGVTPAALGTLTFIRSIVQAGASPLAAYLAIKHDRIIIIASGALAWGVATALVGVCTAYWQVAIVKAFNGIGLAMVVPAIQSLVADLHKENERGLGFGWLHGAGQVGTLFGGVFATLLAARTVGVLAGWRFAFFFVAIVSLVLAAAIYVFAEDSKPPPPVDLVSTEPLVQQDGKTLTQTDLREGSQLKQLWKGTKKVLKVPTFQVILGQGIAGQIPWQAMSFTTLWLELLGFGHTRAAFLVALLAVGNMLGSVFGGWLGDLAAKHFPNAGRIMCSQFSTFVGVPLAAILLLGLPQSVSFAWAYGLVFFFMGFLMSWNSPATNWPIFAEIVPTELHTTVYAIDQAIEKSLAAAGAPLVGLLAQIFFDYKTGKGAFTPDLHNAKALGRGLFVLIACPFIICFLVINLLYCTYPKDRDRVKEADPSAE
ncbi:hypothetical protein M758_8G151500 [Ceratodon purpureus]|nr:hypothetical protein M758_8G151500 [Ceratodon purpureus]